MGLPARTVPLVGSVRPAIMLKMVVAGRLATLTKRSG